MNSVRLGTLKHGHVLEILRGFAQRLEEVAQHREIHFHLLAFEPALEQVGLFIYRRVGDVSHIRHSREDFLALARVQQINRNKFSPLDRRRRPPRDGHNFPSIQLGEVTHARIPDQARSTRDQIFRLAIS